MSSDVIGMFRPGTSGLRLYRCTVRIVWWYLVIVFVSLMVMILYCMIAITANIIDNFADVVSDMIDNTNHKS